ncbi:diphthine--ammonia ligase [Thermogladius sp. KZ2Tp1]|uniref:diphthine--ammonia ligase n=1 Tax=Thermogladius sp. KZ2Tp1 TaxID=3136289 RepID=UPI003DA91E29
MFTGGKDSSSALLRASMNGYRIAVLVSVVPQYDYSYLYHRPHFQALSLQSYSLGVPLETVGVSNESKEREVLEKALDRVKMRYGVETLVTGGLFSRFQKRVFEEVAGRVGLEVYAPWWGVDEEEYLNRVLDMGVKFIIVRVSTMGLPHSLIGKEITREDVDSIIRLSKKYGFNPSFEGGEAETLVVDMPLFRYRLNVDGVVRSVSEYEGYLEIKRVALAAKNTWTPRVTSWS